MKEISRISSRKLNEAEVPQALSILEDAFEDDPLQVYFRQTPNQDDEPIYRANWRERMRDMLRMAIRNDLAWTTDDVGAILTYSVDSESSANADDSSEQGQGPAPASRVLASTPLSEELIKRLGEWKSKIDKAIADNLGDRRKDMMAIDLLATAPMKQGRGYASTLIRKVLDEADLKRQHAWLISSNSANIGFYSYHGFMTKAEIVVGENNPIWDRQPVRIYLMLREAREQQQ